MKKLCLCLALASLLGLGGQAFAIINTIDDVPAATLLLPYFEVDLDQGGINTLFSINNASASAVLAHVTVWSDQSVPVLDFDVYLTGFDVQTISLYDVLVNGDLPRTASVGQDPSGAALNAGISPRGVASPLPFGDVNYPGCTALPYPDGFVSASFRAHLQAWLQGLPSTAVTGSPCAGADRAPGGGARVGDGILRGYITVDTVRDCNLFFPSDWVQYAPFITNQNVLWGDYFYVNTAENFAQGETLVHLEACPAEAITSAGPPPTIPPGTPPTLCFDPAIPGVHTFYGRYNILVGDPLADQREPLPTTMAARYITGGDFDGGTSFLVWREANQLAASYACAAQGPAWFPLEAEQIVIFDETEQPVTVDECPSGDPTCEQEVLIPLEAQRVDVATDLLAPFDFGWVYLNLQTVPLGGNPYGDDLRQTWVTTVMDALGRFSVGFDAIQIDNANTPNTIIIPVP